MHKALLGATVAVAALGLMTACSGGGTSPTPTPSTSPSANSSASPQAEATSPAEDHGEVGAARGSVSGGPEVFEYTVAAGDAASGIAARFGLCTADIYLANEAQDVRGRELVPGQKLRIARMAGPGHDPGSCDDPYPSSVN